MILKPTDQIPFVAVVVYKDDKGLYWTAVDDLALPGLSLKSNNLARAAETVKSELIKRTAATKLQVVAETDLDLVVQSNGEREVPLKLFYINLDLRESSALKWYPFAEVLKLMTQSRLRLPYMKILQFLAGCHKENLFAVELDDELKQAIRDSIKDGSLD
jgi:hypothetical protein